MALRSVVIRVDGGHVHVVAEDGRRRLVDERCNLDEADRVSAELELPVVDDPTAFCGHCFTLDDLAGLPTTRDGRQVILEAGFLP